MMSLCFRAIIFVYLCNFSTEPFSPSSSGETELGNLTLEPEVEAEDQSPSSEEDCFINKLPDPILSSIISFLPIDQAARTSVLSRRWESLGRCTSHLFFDQKYMFSSEFQHWVKSAPWHDVMTQIDAYILMMAEIDNNLVRLIKWLLRSHIGSLRSCRILHLIESCRYEHVGRWVKYLLKKKEVKELSLECESNHCSHVYEDPVIGWTPPVLDLDFKIFSPLECLELTNYSVRTSYSFLGSKTLTNLKLQTVWIEARMLEKVIATCLCLENLSLVGCKKFKRLRVHSQSIIFLELRHMKLHHIDVSASELKVLVFETMITRPKGLVIDVPKLRVFNCYCDPLIRGRTTLGFGRLLLTIKEIVIMFKDLLSTEGHRGANIFEGLVTLSIDLDLSNVRELTFLPFILRLCQSLQKLRIRNEAIGLVQRRNDSLIPYYDLMFRETRGPSSCDEWISQGLKTVIIKGFKGQRLEMRFVKYLIAEAAMIESIVIWFEDECTWDAANTAAETLLSPTGSASANLSITLKPGTKFLAEFGGSWKDWISYLKVQDEVLAFAI